MLFNFSPSLSPSFLLCVCLCTRVYVQYPFLRPLNLHLPTSPPSPSSLLSFSPLLANPLRLLLPQHLIRRFRFGVGLREWRSRPARQTDGLVVARLGPPSWHQLCSNSSPCSQLLTQPLTHSLTTVGLRAGGGRRPLSCTCCVTRSLHPARYFSSNLLHLLPEPSVAIVINEVKALPKV